MSTELTEIDDLDRKIIGILQENALLTNAGIGEMINLSPSAVNERIRKLKDKDVIKKIAAIINANFVKKGLCAFVYVLIDKPDQSNAFLKNAIKNPNILECHHVTGEYSFLLKVRVENTKELESFISTFLKTQKGLSKTLTQIVLSSAKDGTTIID